MRQAIRPGDRLLRVDGTDVTGATLSAAQQALSGQPGQTRTIVVEREGQSITVQAIVRKII